MSTLSRPASAAYHAGPWAQIVGWYFEGEPYFVAPSGKKIELLRVLCPDVYIPPGSPWGEYRSIEAQTAAYREECGHE